MNLVKLSLRQLAARPLPTGLNILILGLGIATITLLLLFSAQMEDRLLRTAKGIDLVVGAKGSPLQLILSTVYHADIPNGNIPLKAAQRLGQSPYVEKAIPLALGDNLRGFRIVGTTTAGTSSDYAALYGGTLAQGRLWSVSMEATLGANVARATGLKLGNEFAGNHGLAAGGQVHDDNLYQVVGIFQPTGTVLDDLVLTDLQSVWDLHESAAPNPPAQHAPAAASDDEDGKPREITALLLQYKTPLAVLVLPRQINANTPMQAASPAMESARLFKLVGFGLDALRVFALILIVTAALSFFVALYTALQARRFDLAVMRMLGSSRFRLFGAVLLEGLWMALAGAGLGLLLGHGVLEGLGRSGLTPGLALTGRWWVAEEIWLPVLSLGVGMISALIPALRAYQIDIATVFSER